MKVKVLSLLVPALLVAGAANAAEIYNKDGNKLDLYGTVKWMVCTISPMTTALMATRPTCVLVSKAKHRLTIN